MRAAALLLLAAPACAGDAFAAWKAAHGRQYSAAEEEQRRACFARNARDIARLNAEGHATFAAGQFADMCPEEFAAERLMKPMGMCTKTPPPVYNPAKPADTQQSVDWRTKGAVTGVKDQGKCGSCWSFSATGVMEGQWFLKNGKLLEFSEQELVSCATIISGNMGCSGGGADTALNWVVKNGGINTEGAYPYVSGKDGKNPKCDTSKKAVKAASFSGKTYIPDHNETLLLAAVQNEGPISITVSANAWQHYSGGILDNDKQMGTDHAVLAVGYGHDGSKAYWIVKNSWGTSFGEDGYIRLAFGKCTSAICSCMNTLVKV